MPPRRTRPWPPSCSSMGTCWRAIWSWRDWYGHELGGGVVVWEWAAIDGSSAAEGSGPQLRTEGADCARWQGRQGPTHAAAQQARGPAQTAPAESARHSSGRSGRRLWPGRTSLCPGQKVSQRPGGMGLAVGSAVRRAVLASGIHHPPRRIPSVTPSLPICWSVARTSAPSRS